jgi:hypothetical protein
MGKYKSSSRRDLPAKQEGPHVIWRGIGCLLMIVIPAISIALGVLTVDYGVTHGWPIPYQLLTAPVLPSLFYKSSGLLIIFGPLTRIPSLYAYISASLLYMLFLSGVISLFYATIYRFTGPSRYGPLDAPPPKIKTKRYTR